MAATFNPLLQFFSSVCLCVCATVFHAFAISLKCWCINKEEQKQKHINTMQQWHNTSHKTKNDSHMQKYTHTHTHFTRSPKRTTQCTLGKEKSPNGFLMQCATLSVCAGHTSRRYVSVVYVLVCVANVCTKVYVFLCVFMLFVCGTLQLCTFCSFTIICTCVNLKL